DPPAEGDNRPRALLLPRPVGGGRGVRGCDAGGARRRGAGAVRAGGRRPQRVGAGRLWVGSAGGGRGGRRWPTAGPAGPRGRGRGWPTCRRTGFARAFVAAWASD